MEKGTGTDEIPAIPVIGAKFKLYRNNEEKGTYTTDSLGKIIINGLYLFDENKNMDQNYTLKEVFIPEGYTKTKDISFKVQMIDSTLTMITDNMLSYKVENNTIKMKVEDSKSFKLVKKDGETNALLPNVKFALFNEDDGEVPARNSKGDILGTKETINGVEYYTLTTNDRGEITADLPEGIYKAVEVEAANEYDLNGQEKYFGIGRNREGDIRYVPEMVKNIGGTENDRANNVLATSDGGYIITLNLNSSVEIEGNFYDNPKLIIKYNSSDYIEWIEKIDLGKIETIAVTHDEGYLIAGCFIGTDVQIGNQTLSSNGSSDCGIIKLNSEGEIEWAKSFGGTDFDAITSLTTTIDGGFIVGGYFESSSMQVGDTTLNSNGRDDVFVAKYDSVGEVEWVNSFGGNLDEKIGSIVQIADGSYIVGGSFRSLSIIIGNYTLTKNGEFDGYIAKYNSIGEVEWTSSFGGTKDEYIYSVTPTEDGGCIVGGSFFSSSIVVDGITLENYLSSMNNSDGFLIKYNSNQEVVWANRIGGNGGEVVHYAKNTLDGGYLVTGTFGSKIDFGNYRIMNSSNYLDAFIIKYNRVDEVEWVGTIPGTSYDFISETDLTTDGKIIAVGGLLSDNIQLNDFYISKKDKAYDKSDGLIIKYKPTDKIDIDFENAAIIGAEKDTNISLLDKSIEGGYYVGGFYESSSIQIGENTFTNFNNNNDGVLIKYNTKNNVEWSKSIDGGELTSIKSTSDGGCIVSGTYYIDDFHIGQYNLNNEGNEDTFIAKYDIDGNVEWATSLGKNGHDFIYSIAETNDGGFVLGGCFDSENLTIGQFSFNNIQGNNHSDALIVKVNSQGVVEWATAISGNDEDSIKNVIATKDGGYLVQGKYNSGIIQIGDELFTNVDNEIESFIIKFNSDNEVEWAKNIPAVIEAVSQSSDEGIILAGSFNSSNIQIGEFKFYNKRGNEFPKKNDGLIIKYTIDGYLEWAKSIASELDDIIYSIWNTEDGGFIIGGSFNSYGILIGPDAVYPKNALEYDGIIVKYDNKGTPEWASNVGDTKLDEIKAVIETTNKKYIALGSFESDTIKVGNYTLTNTGAKDAMILNINTVFNVKEQEEIVFENQIKRYKITTDVKEINGNKGGMISGEDNAPYESVKYGENSTKIVKMIPDENYEIIGITINGKEYPYIPLPDGSYQMPQFENMTEDKHIEVAFSLKDNKITINKIDKNTGEKLSNADFNR